MDVNRSIYIVISLSQSYRSMAGLQVSTRIDDGRHASFDCPSQHLVPILVEVWKIQMTVRINHPPLVCNAAISASTISRMSSSKLTLGSQPSLAPALLASPTSRSTSAGRKN